LDYAAAKLSTIKTISQCKSKKEGVHQKHTPQSPDARCTSERPDAGLIGVVAPSISLFLSSEFTISGMHVRRQQ
jgi:hypothetical protein